jgi:adenine/guanine phosphoribosyltransferase-like PRPP-binding protein
VLVVDDRAETGSNATTTRRLMEKCDGGYVGPSLLVDELPAQVREELSPVATLAFADELCG